MKGAQEAGDEQVEALTRGLRVRIENRQLSIPEQPGAPRVHGAPPNPFERDAVPMISTPVKAVSGPRS
jgi:hypothetical protein